MLSSPPGTAIWRSSAIWSAGVVVVRPHPGQANPAHSTHGDGVVSARPAFASNERIPPAPPTASHRSVAESLSLSSIMVCASAWSAPDSPPEPCCVSSVSRMPTLTTLASACGVPGPMAQSWRVLRSYTAAATVPARPVR